MTSQCSTRTPSSMRTTSAAIQEPIGELIRIRHENDVGGQSSLLLQEILGVLIQIGGRSRIHEENPCLFCGKFCGMVDEVMNLLHTVGALIAGESPQHDHDEIISSLLGRHPHCFPWGS